MIIDDTAAAFYTTLTGGTALTALLAGTTSVYHMQAPEAASYQYVVFNHQAGGPTGDSPALMENNVWWVRVYSVTSAKTCSQAFAQVDALLHRKNITISGATTIWCQRETNITLVELSPTGIPIYTCGGMYRIITTNT